MHKMIFFLIGMFLSSCNQSQNNKSDSAAKKVEVPDLNKSEGNFDWLLGNWIRLNTEGDKKTFENWKKETGNLFIGHGFVMQGVDTVWQEKMVLINKYPIWVLVVETPGNDDLVEFKLTQQDPSYFTVENPIHDFPKKIKYWKDGEKLNALVSGGENEITFEFERIE